ncbi:hypothetical protein G6F37_005555 [Rhizopus arrhizus]|nr:hypothetical protein G6F38_002061 [Rhizopus arrhizus]KAG1158703.1 hypothetical protein G6F37_005555 [Rhizopus arrhizus]
MFSKVNPFDESVVAATDENLTSENWELILTVTDKLSLASPESARDCVAAVEKRLNNRNPNVQLYALALAEALVKNCDLTVHREISSRSFTNALVKLIHDRSIHSKVRVRILEFIQLCSFEFRADSTLGLMNEVYHSLRAEGVQFPSPQKPKKEFTQSELDKQKEEEEFQLALALSLSESENKRPSFKASETTTTTTAATTNTNKKENDEPQISRVRALYDFQPTEQGELGFEKGDIIRVIESVYRDWWKGELRGKTGIFPVNYVEKIVDPSPSDLMKEASIENEVMNQTSNIDHLLELLTSNDPRIRDSFSDNEELQSLYNAALSIRPKLVKLIEKYSLKKDELVSLNEKFMQARTMYDTMLSSSIARYSAPYGYPSAGHQPYSYEPQPQSQQPQQPQQQYYNYQPYSPSPSQPQTYNYPSSAPQPPTPVQPNTAPPATAYPYNENGQLPPPTPQQTARAPESQYQPSYDQNNQQQPPLQHQNSDYLYQTTSDHTMSPSQQQPYSPYPPYQSPTNHTNLPNQPPLSYPTAAHSAAPVYNGQQQPYANNY